MEVERRKRRLEALRAWRRRPVIGKTARLHIGEEELPVTLVEIGMPKII